MNTVKLKVSEVLNYKCELVQGVTKLNRHVFILAFFSFVKESVLGSVKVNSLYTL